MTHLPTPRLTCPPRVEGPSQSILKLLNFLRFCNHKMRIRRPWVAPFRCRSRMHYDSFATVQINKLVGMMKQRLSFSLNEY